MSYVFVHDTAPNGKICEGYIIQFSSGKGKHFIDFAGRKSFVNNYHKRWKFYQSGLGSSEEKGKNTGHVSIFIKYTTVDLSSTCRHDFVVFLHIDQSI